MALSRLDMVASTFQLASESLHDKFLAMTSNAACTGCQHSGFGEAILAAWLQTRWIEFTRDLVVASALGTRRTSGNPVQPVAGVKSQADAERVVKAATTHAVKKHGASSPVWHAPWFVIEVSNLIGLRNLPKVQAALGPTVTPEQITNFRNYLVHPGNKTRYRYAALQEKLGFLRMEPEHLLHQQQKPGLTVFTAWVRELQRVAYDSTR